MTRFDQIPMTDKIVRSVRVPCLKCKEPTAQTEDTEVAGHGHICLSCRASRCGCGHHKNSHPWVQTTAYGMVPDWFRGPCRFCDCGKMNPAKTAWGAAVLLGLSAIEGGAL